MNGARCTPLLICVAPYTSAELVDVTASGYQIAKCKMQNAVHRFGISSISRFLVQDCECASEFVRAENLGSNSDRRAREVTERWEIAKAKFECISGTSVILTERETRYPELAPK